MLWEDSSGLRPPSNSTSIAFTVLFVLPLDSLGETFVFYFFEMELMGNSDVLYEVSAKYVSAIDAKYVSAIDKAWTKMDLICSQLVFRDLRRQKGWCKFRQETTFSKNLNQF